MTVTVVIPTDEITVAPKKSIVDPVPTNEPSCLMSIPSERALNPDKAEPSPTNFVAVITPEAESIVIAVPTLILASTSNVVTVETPVIFNSVAPIPPSTSSV